MEYWSEFLGLALIHFLAVVTPGPDFAITVRQSIRFGSRAGMCTAIGIGAGISVHVLYTLLGVSALMHTSPGLMTIAKFMGGAYLAYLGIQMLRSRKAATEQLQEGTSILETQSWRQALWLGFLTNAMNPKATLFFLAVFTTVVSRSTPLAVQALYGAWMCIVNAAWFILVSLLFSRHRVRQQFLRLGQGFERIMGGVLLLFSARLLFGD